MTSPEFHQCGKISTDPRRLRSQYPQVDQAGARVPFDTPSHLGSCLKACLPLRRRIDHEHFVQGDAAPTARNGDHQASQTRKPV